MRIGKIIIGALLSVIFLISFLIHMNSKPVEAASNVSLAKKTIKLTEGDNIKIELVNVPKKATITYKSADKTIAKVSVDGEVTAIKPGSCKIKVYVKTRKKTVKLKVKVKVKAKKADTNAKQWDIVEFGRYEQDNNPENGTEPIEWYVLSKENGKVLLLSRYALDCVMYQDYDDNSLENDFPGGSVGDIAWDEIEFLWKNSDLRKWLNGEFYERAFSEEEKQYIASVYQNETYARDDTDIEEVTEKVTLLSLDDIVNPKYGFSKKSSDSDVKRRCLPTEYAKAKGIEISVPYGFDDDIPSCYWWLKAPAKGLLNAAGVDESGAVDPNGLDQADDTVGVRPVIIVEENFKYN